MLLKKIYRLDSNALHYIKRREERAKWICNVLWGWLGSCLSQNRVGRQKTLGK